MSILFVLLAASGIFAQETRIKWFGHAAFSITTPQGKVLLIDPWLANPKNPEAANGKDPLQSLSKVDYILLTHGHRDHVGEAAAIAKVTGAQLIATPELARNLMSRSRIFRRRMGATTLWVSAVSRRSQTARW